MCAVLVTLLLASRKEDTIIFSAHNQSVVCLLQRGLPLLLDCLIFAAHYEISKSIMDWYFASFGQIMTQLLPRRKGILGLHDESKNLP